ncbi:hypothetical protein [Acinetobacter larvae]|uniref:hypothetical protein n=1 Tax=Acinetobacter larvae TaxID=1789224 RepID=UPI0012FE1C6F|nr:hypothetical protein [Acinetobacter larvae]
MPAIFSPSDFTVYFVVHLFDSPLVYQQSRSFLTANTFLNSFQLSPQTTTSTLAYHSIYDTDVSSAVLTIGRKARGKRKAWGDFSIS